MGYVKTKGIVIKGINVGEADRIITIFSKSHGRITGFAKSARRPKSKLVAGTQLLCYSDFVMYKGKDMYSINSCDVIEPFYEIRSDVVKLTYAAHLCDLINDTIQPEQPSSRALQLFLNTLYLLSKTDRSPELITRIFELRLLAVLGYAPQVKSCICCGSEDFEKVYFSFSDCGFVCQNCIDTSRRSMSILPGTAKAIRHIIHSKINNLFSFNVSQDVLEELGRITRIYLKDRLDRDYNRLDFLKSLKLE